MRIAVAYLIATLACGCDAGPAHDADATLTPLRAVPSAFGVKTTGTIVAVLDDRRVKARIDPLNQGEAAVFNGALILLRAGPATRLGCAEERSGCALTAINDLHAGESAILVFRTDDRDPTDGSFLALVINRR